MTAAHHIDPIGGPDSPPNGGRWRALLCGAGLLFGAQAAVGQAVDDESARVEIAEQRSLAEARYQQQRWECSRRFFVTACMEKARAEHRATIEAADRREAEIDRRQRHERAQKRLAIIQQKTEALARLAPLPTAEPVAQSLPAAAEETGQPRAAGGTEARVDPRAAAERAARARAEASERRRAEAEQRRVEREKQRAEQKTPAAGLPERPLIPLPTN